LGHKDTRKLLDTIPLARFHELHALNRPDSYTYLASRSRSPMGVLADEGVHDVPSDPRSAVSPMPNLVSSAGLRSESEQNLRLEREKADRLIPRAKEFPDEWPEDAVDAWNAHHYSPKQKPGPVTPARKRPRLRPPPRRAVSSFAISRLAFPQLGQLVP
jgi:hypothetical protein